MVGYFRFSGHAGSKEFDTMKPALMTTTGYVYSKDKKHLKHLQVMMIMKKLLVIEMFFQ